MKKEKQRRKNGHPGFDRYSLFGDITSKDAASSWRAVDVLHSDS